MFNALTETFNGPSVKTVRPRNDEIMKEYGIKDNLVGFTFKDDKHFRKYIINCKKMNGLRPGALMSGGLSCDAM